MLQRLLSHDLPRSRWLAGLLVLLVLALAVPTVAMATTRQPDTIRARRPKRSPSGASNAPPMPLIARFSDVRLIYV